MRSRKKTRFFGLRGTEGSNPLPSSKESANFQSLEPEALRKARYGVLENAPTPAQVAGYYIQKFRNTPGHTPAAQYSRHPGATAIELPDANYSAARDCVKLGPTHLDQTLLGIA
jgi:hypothetical protein